MNGYLAELLAKWIRLFDALHGERVKQCEEVRREHLLECACCVPIWDDSPHSSRDCRRGLNVSELWRYSLDDPTNVPVLDLNTPPRSTVILPLAGWAVVCPSRAEETLRSIELADRGCALFPSEALPEPEPEPDPELASGALGCRPSTPVGDEIRRRKRWLRSEIGLHDELLTVELCRDASYEAVRAALCREARVFLRYREGLEYEHLGLLVEALVSDALLRMLEELSETGSLLCRWVEELLGYDGPIHEVMSGGGIEQPDLRFLAKQLPSETGTHADQMLRASVLAGEHLAAGRLQDVALAIHRAERARRMWWTYTWEPLTMEGMAHLRQNHRRGHYKREAEGLVDGADRRRALNWAYFIVDYCRQRGKGRFGQACRKAGETLFDADGTVMGEAPEEEGLCAKTVRNNVRKHFGLRSENVSTIELPSPPCFLPDPVAEEHARVAVQRLRSLRDL